MDDLSVRDRILRAALTIIGTDGIAAVSNRRIAAQAGVSLGSITYHFPTQNDLLREALRGFVTEETQRLHALADKYRDGQTVDSATALVDQAVRDISFSAEQIAPFELYVQAGREPELRAAASECFAAYDALASTILDALEVPSAVAPTIVATVTGLQLRRLATGDAGQDISSALRTLIRGAGA